MSPDVLGRKFLEFLCLQQNSISTTCTAEINVIDADVDVGTNDTTLARLMDSDLKSVYSYFEKGCRKKCALDNPER